MFTAIQSTVPWIDGTTTTSGILWPDAVGLIALVIVKSDRSIGSPGGTQKSVIGPCYATCLLKPTDIRFNVCYGAILNYANVVALEGLVWMKRLPKKGSPTAGRGVGASQSL